MEQRTVSAPSKQDLIDDYQAALDRLPKEALELGLKLSVRTVQALSRGRPITPEELVDAWEMPREQVEAVLEQAVGSGQAEVDEQGALVGGILTLEPTDHEITLGDTTVFAWCALDAIYVPGIVGRTARIRSTDPVTGGAVHLTVAPTGVEDVRPAGAVLSVVGTDVGTEGGRTSPRCSRMLFFESDASARRWTRDVPGVVILTPSEALEVADVFVINAARTAGLL